MTFNKPGAGWWSSKNEIRWIMVEQKSKLRRHTGSLKKSKLLYCVNSLLWQIFRIGAVRYTEGLWRMRRHGPVIAHCTDSEDFLLLFLSHPVSWTVVRTFNVRLLNFPMARGHVWQPGKHLRDHPFVMMLWPSAPPGPIQIILPKVDGWHGNMVNNYYRLLTNCFTVK